MKSRQRKKPSRDEEKTTPFFNQRNQAISDVPSSFFTKNTINAQAKQNNSAANLQSSGRETSPQNGEMLPNYYRNKMEASFGEDFSNVRIHKDQHASEMNRALNSRAFTRRNDIYFSAGEFDPSSTKGSHLLAHELTHVVQQNSLRPAPSIQRAAPDPIPETNRQFYGHGAFMGAAPQLMADPKWNRILQVLMPDVHRDATAWLRVSGLFGNAGSPELILMFENNPVMAAYGMYQTQQMDVRREGGRSDRVANMEAIEWDVFLPDAIVEEYNEAVTDEEKARLAHQMVSEMIIAHGTPTQTFRENLPWGGIRQYENVRGTRKTDQGGVRPGAWMDLFGRALQLATDPACERRAADYLDPALHPRVNDPDDQAAHQTFQNQLSFREVIDLYKQMFGKETFSVLLDIKSRDASPEVLRALVGDLNLRGVHVYGVGSFRHSEIAGLGSMTQTVDGRTYTGPREIKFFHYAGDLQEACLANKIRQNDTVMFNAGSLISYDRLALGPDKKASYAIKNDVVHQLEIYKRHYGFNLGVYVQENDIDDRAATMITELTNSRRDIFNLGFAWGGLSGQTASDIEPSLSNATVGTHNQGIVGKHWDTDKPIPTSPAPVGSGFTSTIRMRYRYMESRRFQIDSGSVTVSCNASWNEPDCNPDTYFMTLVREIDWWPDKEKGSFGFPIGNERSANWSGLESGDYFLRIWFRTDHDPRCILSGDITVSI